MTLDEAVAKAKADGDVQLAEWLRQARGAESAARWYTKKLRDAHLLIRWLLNENAKLRKAMDFQALELGCMTDNRDILYLENAKLLERMELLTTILRNDYDIDASWDDLRRFWSIELTEDGCSMRDRACKAEAENAKLRELCKDLFDRLMDKDEHCGECRSQCEHDAWNFGDPKCVYAKRVRELGIEVVG